MSASDRSDVAPSDGVEAVDGIGNSRGEKLRAEGYETVESLQDASLADLILVLPDDVARSVKDQVGNVAQSITTAAQAREQAQGIPGAKAKIVKGPNGKQQPKVLKKVDDRHEAGASIEIHKG